MITIIISYSHFILGLSRIYNSTDFVKLEFGILFKRLRRYFILYTAENRIYIVFLRDKGRIDILNQYNNTNAKFTFTIKLKA